MLYPLSYGGGPVVSLAHGPPRTDARVMAHAEIHRDRRVEATDLAALSGRTVVVSSHLLAEVEQTCTHAVVVNKGRIVASGLVDDIVGESPSVQLDVSDVPAATRVLMSVELILLAVNVNLVAFSAFLGDLTGQVFALLVMTVAAAESAIGLAILVVFYRNKGTISVEDINMMKG